MNNILVSNNIEMILKFLGVSITVCLLFYTFAVRRFCIFKFPIGTFGGNGEFLTSCSALNCLFIVVVVFVF